MIPNPSCERINITADEEKCANLGVLLFYSLVLTFLVPFFAVQTEAAGMNSISCRLLLFPAAADLMGESLAVSEVSLCISKSIERYLLCSARTRTLLSVNSELG